MDEPRLKRVFNGLNVVAVGLILLANTTGALPWSVWWSVFSLWPVLLVAAGVDIIGRSMRNSALRILASLLVIGGLAYGALVLPSTTPSGAWYAGGSGRPFSLADPGTGEVSSGTAVVRTGVGRLTMRSGQNLATADGMSPFGIPTLETTREGSSADVRIGPPGRRVGPVLGGARSVLDVTLGRGVTWESIEVQAGLSESDIDLSDLEVTRTKLSLGLSSSRVSFGTKASDAEATIDGGMSSLTIRVPSDLGVEIDARTGLGSLRVPSGWERTSGSGAAATWRSDGYSGASSRLRLRIDAGLSSVAVERY
jgi:hypothetical protein